MRSRSRFTRLGAALALACTLPACRVAPPAATASTAATRAAGCAVPALPEPAALPRRRALPDLFTFIDGRPVTTRVEWACRRAELAAQAQRYELGPVPAAGDGADAVAVRAEVTDGAAGRRLLVSVTRAGKTISFPVTVTLPPGAGPGPYPALIGMGAASLDNEALARMGIALVTFPNDAIAAQQDAGSRGKGKFYELYGSDHPAGAMAAWAWGVRRLVDALERTPAAGIDATRLGITGCSRNGKGALVAGAFEPRIRLVVAQESGAGGAAGWRVSEAQRAEGRNVQTLGQIVQENVWFTRDFALFGADPARLPIDQHAIMALVAPRGLLVLENTSMEWLGNRSAWVTSLAARQAWQALGAPTAMGISQVGGHAHCRLPAAQYGIVDAFARRFLLDDAAADTGVAATDGGFQSDPGTWVERPAPALR